MTSYISIDIGGSNTRIGFFPNLDAPNFTILAKFPTCQSYKQQLDAISNALQTVSLASLAGIGISIAGRLAKDGQSIIVAPNLPEYVNQPFAHEISLLAGCPVRLAHDAVCGLLAEKKFGVIRDVDRSAYLTVSTGTGAAFQLSQANIRLTSSIEIGHQILDGNTRQCLCGQIGCLETYTGGRQLELRYGQSLAEITDSVFWNTFADKLALGLVNLAMLTRVDVIAISGAIALSNPLLIAQVQHNIDAMLVGAALEVRIAILGENAPLVGAALLLETPQETLLH
jgi:predicted NBD/HSP70 family sugar kinase